MLPRVLYTRFMDGQHNLAASVRAPHGAKGLGTYSMRLLMEARMRRFMRFAVTVLAVVGVAAVVVQTARADEVKAPVKAAVGETRPIYRRPPGRRVDSVVTNPRSVLTGPKRGTGWLVHSGTEKPDPCERADAVSGLRMMCMGW